MKFNYDNKVFKVAENTENGETSSDTIFYYQQEGNIVFASYSGGSVVKGNLLGTVDELGILKFNYHQINTKGELMQGKCTSTPELTAEGKIRLNEEWEWTSGDCSKGKSVIIEVD
jgi:hypothetical protein